MFLIRWSKRGKFAQDVIGHFPAFNQTPVDMGKPVLRWSKREYKRMKEKRQRYKKKYKVFNQTSMEMGKPAARCKNQNVLRDVKYACKWIQLLNDFLRPKSIVTFFDHEFFQDQVYQKSALSCLLDVYKYNLNVQDSLTRFKCLCEKIPTKYINTKKCKNIARQKKKLWDV